MNQIPNIEEEFANKLSSSIRYSAGKGQYEAFPDCQDAYLDGVETAIAMMYIDLTGTPKTKGMLTKFLHHQLQKARQDWLREEIVKLEGEKLPKTNEHGSRSFFVGAGAQMRMDTHNQALQTIIDRYHFELDQDKEKLKKQNNRS